jgi:hypothetical protein
MAENYLITGYWGEPHVTAENDRGIHAAIFGAGRFVLPVGEQFKAEYIGNNKIRLYDGKLLDNGAAGGIPAGEYIDLVIPNAGQAMKRNDLIVFQYSKNASTLVENGNFLVIHGTETDGTATDPVLTQEDLLSNNALFDQMPLYRVSVSATEISAPEKVFVLAKNVNTSGGAVVEATSEDGTNYVATVDGIDRLYSGLELTIIPNIASTTTAPTLNVNGLGAKPIRLSLSLNNSMLVQPKESGYYAAGRPVKLLFDSKYLATGAWRVSNKQRPSAQDLYGAAPIENGGHGADNAEEGMQNLLAAGAVILSSLQFGDTLPDPGTPGRLFFKKVT